MNHHRPFLVLWVLAVTASVAAFVLHLAMRSKSVHLGYELGRARAEQARLREVKRVLELEVASYHTPQRVEIVARTLLHMEAPAPDRIIAMAPIGTAAGASLPPSTVAATAPERGARSTGQVRAMVAADGPRITPPVPTATELVAPKITPPRSAAVEAP